MSMKGVLDKIGLGGLILVAICCLRLELVFSLLIAIGVGFLTHNTFLMPAMGVLLALILTGLALDYRIHRRAMSLMIAAPAATVLYFFVFIHRVNAAVYVALSGLILARIFNFILVSRTTRPSTRNDEQGRSRIELLQGQHAAGRKEPRQASG